MAQIETGGMRLSRAQSRFTHPRQEYAHSRSHVNDQNRLFCPDSFIKKEPPTKILLKNIRRTKNIHDKITKEQKEHT